VIVKVRVPLPPGLVMVMLAAAAEISKSGCTLTFTGEDVPAW